MKDRSNDPPHHERTLLPQSYISLPKYQMKALVKFLIAAHIKTYYSLTISQNVKSIWFIFLNQPFELFFVLASVPQLV